MMSRRVMVTGSTGFVGPFLTRELTEAGCTCVPFEAPDGALVDLRDVDAVDATIARIEPDAVVHLAAQSNVPRSFDDPRETFDINVGGTLNLLMALREHGFTGRFLFVGSGAVYGRVQEDALPVQETRSPAPTNPYAASKVAAEALCYQWGQSEDFEVVCVRPFNHIGPGQTEDFAIASFAKQIVEAKLGRREPVMDVGDVDVTRDFTDVRDVVRAYRLLLEAGENGEVYNVCSGEEHSLRALIERMAESAGVSMEVRQDAERLRRADQRRMLGDASKLKAATRWAPERTIEQTLDDVMAHWEKQL